MAGKKKTIWAYLFPKRERPGKNILQKSIYIHKIHPGWNLYILLEGEPEDWGFEKYNSGYRLYSYQFLHINPHRADDKTGSRNKPDMGKNPGNTKNGKSILSNSRTNIQAMKLTPEKYCQFLSKLPITERKWSNIEPSKTKSGRKRILEKYGPYAFLDPENLKYPIISRKGEFSPKGLLAAYKRARQWGDDKIAALAEQIGKCMGLSWALLNPSQIQSFLFDRTFWTLKSARKWLKEHGFEYHNYERTPNYYRFPQQKPEKFIKFRTKDFGNGIKAIIGFKDLISNPNEPYNSNMATLKDVVEELRKLRKEYEITRKDLKKEYEITRKELGKVTRSLSNIPEGFTKEAILQALKTAGFRNAKLISFGEVALPGVEDWADAWLTARKKGKEWVFYIEIKTTARPEDINEFVNSIKEVQKQKEFKNKKVQGIFAAVKFENAYKKQALKKGLWIMIPSEKGMKIEKP